MTLRHRKRLVDHLNARFVEALDPPSARRAETTSAVLLGIEHEYRVVARGEPVDFRSIVHTLGLGQPHLDPGDPHAYRLDSGAVLTCDGQELEVALPPQRLEPHFTENMDSRAASERGRATALLPEMTLQGYSTHISVSVPQELNERVARLYLRTFAPAFMLFVDDKASPGLLVRPRPHRLELCGEYADGPRLRAALALAAGSVAVCVGAVAADASRYVRALPPELTLDVIPAQQRFGWFVARGAFGPDLYNEGRQAILRLARDGTTTAQEQLQVAWELAREALSGSAAPEDLEVADAMVEGTIPLPSEKAHVHSTAARDETLVPTTFGGMLAARHRRGFSLAPVMVTWDVTIYIALNTTGTRRAFVCIPRDLSSMFLERLGDGSLDDAIERYLAAPRARRRLSSHDMASDPGIYDDIGPRSALLATEHPHS